MGKFGLFTDEANIDFAVKVLPFGRGAECYEKFVECESLLF
jgi:hypothetical protein